MTVYHHRLEVGDLAHPQAPRHEPSPELAALQAHVDRWKRYEKAQPGHGVQIDVKFIAPLKGSRKSRYYQFTAIDDCTRLRVLRLYDRLNQKTAINFIDYALERFPFRVDVIQTDTVRSSRPHSTGTYSTKVSATNTSSRRHRGSTARSSGHTGSTPRSSIRSSTAL